jgi:two-component sensor histidine kinase
MLKAEESSRLNKAPSPKAQETRDLRQKLLTILLRVIAIGSAVALIPSVYLSIRERLWLVLAADLAAGLLLVALNFLPGLTYRVKVVALVSLPYLLGVILIIFTGPFGAGHLYLFAFAFLAALFGGRASMIAANLLAILTHVALAAASAAGLLPWGQGLGSVIVISSNFTLVSLALSFAASYLVNGYAAAAAEDRRMRAALEIVLQEIEHRVKNNLQVISSMVNLKSRPDIEPGQAIADIKASLSAISSVHQLLYRKDSVYLVRLRSLIDSLVERFRSLHRAIVFETSWEGEEAIMDSERAVDLGLLVNEIVMNSVKHAFPAGGAGKIFIEVAFEAAGRTLSLRIGDDGSAQPAVAGEAEPSGGRGLKIISALAKHLGAEMERESGPGYVYRLKLVIPVASADLAPQE